MRIFARREVGAYGPVATYAAVLDGTHLWWHVPGQHRLILRSESGDEVPVDTDPFALDGLTGLRYDVLVDGQPVAAPALPDRAPSRAPVAPDGTQYDVAVVEGRLQVVRTPGPVLATLTAVSRVDDRIHLTVTAPAGITPDAGLVLADEGNQVTATLPGRSLGVADLPVGADGVLRLGVGDEESWVRIRRSRTDLVDPHHAVLLPELTDHDDPDRVRARLRWTPDSLLVIRLLAPDVEPGGPTAVEH